MRMTPARAARITYRSQLDFDPLADPRDPRGKRHSLAGLLGLYVVGFACLQTTLRSIEELGECLGSRLLRRLGLRTEPSDTTLYEVVARLPGFEALREVNYALLRKDIDQKVIRNDLFPMGVLSLDGKGAGGGLGIAPHAARNSTCDSEGTPCWDLYTSRACLTSSRARPVLDQEFIGRDSTEYTVFQPLLRRLVETFPKLFEVITVDAGVASRENARLVRELKRHYLFALKKNAGRIFNSACERTAAAPVLAASCEQAKGHAVTRQLRRVAVPDECDYPGVREFWRVEELIDGVLVDTRVFLCSLAPERLSDDQALGLVRLHWGIENGANWTADMILAEDQGSPCEVGTGVAVVSWLRILAYNLLSGVRAHMPAKDRRPATWKAAALEMLQALLLHDLLLPVPPERVALPA